MDSKPFRTTRRLVNLRQGRNDWYKIRNAAETGGQFAQLSIYDEIGFFGVTASDMLTDLAAVEGDLEVHLNTPGGEVFDGIAIFNALKQRDGIVRIVVDSLAASIGSVIAMAADPGNLIMARNATMMIHDGFGLSVGNAADMREMADLLDKTSDNIASIYADRTGMPAAQWRSAMQAETWYVGQEAVDAGLADFVLGAEPPDPGPSALTWDLSIFTRAPQGTDSETGQFVGQAVQDYRHVTNASVDESAWDGPAAMSAASKADDPAAALSAICAGTKAGDPKTQAAHALPHHKHQGDPPNRSGVSAALGRIDSTQDLTNKAAAEAHLNAHKAAMPDASNHAELPAWLTQDAEEA